MKSAAWMTTTVVAVLAFMPASWAQDTEAQHRYMLEEIAHDFLVTADLTGREKMQPAVEKAMSTVPRHKFVLDAYTEQAYVNRPLQIGHGQTISQPYIVAIMTDLLDPKPDHRILEIGTGSGYQAAVLAEIVDQVYTIEIIEPLAITAEERLKGLGYDNVHVRTGDGNHGWPEAAPFDGIVVTAAGRLPPALVEQLAPGGRMVIPIARNGSAQELVVVTKNDEGEVSQQPVLPVLFVPLTGDN